MRIIVDTDRITSRADELFKGVERDLREAFGKPVRVELSSCVTDFSRADKDRFRGYTSISYLIEVEGLKHPSGQVLMSVGLAMDDIDSYVVSDNGWALVPAEEMVAKAKFVREVMRKVRLLERSGLIEVKPMEARASYGSLLCDLDKGIGPVDRASCRLVDTFDIPAFEISCLRYFADPVYLGFCFPDFDLFPAIITTGCPEGIDKSSYKTDPYTRSEVTFSRVYWKRSCSSSYEGVDGTLIFPNTRSPEADSGRVVAWALSRMLGIPGTVFEEKHRDATKPFIDRLI